MVQLSQSGQPSQPFWHSEQVSPPLHPHEFPLPKMRRRIILMTYAKARAMMM